MKSNGLWELVTGLIIITVVFMLVRPGSPAATAIGTLSAAMAAMISTATGYSSTQSSTTNGT